MIKLSPSLLACDFGNIAKELQEVEKAGVEYIHLDVMDGVFVPNISFGLEVIKSIRKYSNMIFDVHLMIVEPEKYIERFAQCGADIINIHVEATKNLVDTITSINNLGVKSGVTLKPNTPISEIDKVLKDVDLILIMSVEPGFGGQKFQSNQLDKVRELVKLREENGYKYKIEIDGGINLETIEEVSKSGVDIVVAGTAIFNSKPIKENVLELNSFLNKY